MERVLFALVGLLPVTERSINLGFAIHYFDLISRDQSRADTLHVDGPAIIVQRCRKVTLTDEDVAQQGDRPDEIGVEPVACLFNGCNARFEPDLGCGEFSGVDLSFDLLQVRIGLRKNGGNRFRCLCGRW